MTTSRAYGGRTADERRAERRARLVEAALDVLAEHGAAGVTVNRLCRAAGLNERYYYESFAQVDDALEAVVEHVGGQLLASIMEALATSADEPSARASAVIGAVVDLARADPRVGALLVASGAHPVLAARRRAHLDVVVELMIAEGASTLHLERTTALEPWARFTATFLSGGLVEALSAWITGSVDLSRDQFVEHAVGMFLAGANLPNH
ncbi:MULTISPECIES: TetR/AcrR family transcriptional regulator [unclassified Nocardioides]|uniref:TetR/AcrR family transcriptional regulator n=1 Tax=unclassified Nocardioides TaxID=2615069 RepID=UPI0006F77180|nr:MULTISPECIES: TetR/AcrR family transcriptional regulator [unclassified Nocardioides]KRA37709.1 hypothetical protein ASD81_03140 [Nocardioides sp. Root614]KRA91669.1 hypothetical protein ASD84_03405 [Nocardioides sp. Root682]